MYERYAGLIFDMDGTILDTEPTHRKAWREVLGHYGLQYDVQAMIALNGSPTWRIAQAIIELNQADLDPHALAREKTEAVRSMLLDSVEPLPLVEVVKSWHGRRPMVVGTGSESAIAEALLAHLGLRRYFDAVVAADHVKHHKPAPDTFLLCAQRMGVQPTQCVVFEDADFGIQAARAAGMDAVDVRLLWVKRYRFSRCLPVVFSALHYYPATPKSCWWQCCFLGSVIPGF
ncbi:HAD-superfamily hydrolase, subfamily IA, variant 3 family protein [Shigella dysenteriae 1617]|nr:Fructose-1-phosphate phosphatase YqaB [Shigella dysenteriae 1617]EFP71454.1 HAD-superfamily hydrolase, subfamily IA, variant 3 family protein [Shigella dysenteriae 1617]ESU81599.1 Fructose-1-phosphate phosphatase YqaB [Shigella dysenteriae WRSd3]ESU82777.1 Fructose-1-phosphate phosphatase YqaB [Shigella dysenteriae WRSd5]SPZ79828.1 fructose-1-phosphatase [Shigella dysenteriae]